MRGFARAFLADAEEGDDVAQETFRDLWLDRASLHLAGSLRAHLLARVRNLCLTRARSRRRAGARMKLVAAEPNGPVTTPADHLEAREAQSDHLRIVVRLAGVIRELSEDMRTVIYMRFWGGASFEEISLVLGRPPHAVRAQLYRQLAQLRGRLEET